jgi:hypothetical protein
VDSRWTLGAALSRIARVRTHSQFKNQPSNILHAQIVVSDPLNQYGMEEEKAAARLHLRVSHDSSLRRRTKKRAGEWSGEWRAVKLSVPGKIELCGSYLGSFGAASRDDICTHDSGSHQKASRNIDAWCLPPFPSADTASLPTTPSITSPSLV